MDWKFNPETLGLDLLGESSWGALSSPWCWLETWTGVLTMNPSKKGNQKLPPSFKTVSHFWVISSGSHEEVVKLEASTRHQGIRSKESFKVKKKIMQKLPIVLERIKHLTHIRIQKSQESVGYFTQCIVHEWTQHCMGFATWDRIQNFCVILTFHSKYKILSEHKTLIDNFEEMLII